MDSRQYRELNGIDGEPVELEWHIFPGHTTLELLHEIQRKMAENRIRPEEYKDRIIFMSMYNDMDWTKDGNLKMNVSNSIEVKANAIRLSKGHRSFLGSGTEGKWYGTHTYKQIGLWSRSAKLMMPHFGECGHSVFRATSEDP